MGEWRVNLRILEWSEIFKYNFKGIFFFSFKWKVKFFFFFSSFTSRNPPSIEPRLPAASHSDLASACFTLLQRSPISANLLETR